MFERAIARHPAWMDVWLRYVEMEEKILVNATYTSLISLMNGLLSFLSKTSKSRKLLSLIQLALFDLVCVFDSFFLLLLSRFHVPLLGVLFVIQYFLLDSVY